MIKAVEVLRTFQGEIGIGKRVLLIRFKKCNNSCYFCDTKNKLRDMVEGEYSLDNIQEIISSENRGLLITGGEPLYDPNYNQTVDLLGVLTYPFADVETNGYNLLKLYDSIKDWDVIDKIKFIMSPKLYHNGQQRQYIEECVKTIGDRLILKILDQSRIEIAGDFILKENQKELEFLKFLSGLNFGQNIYMMPMGKTKDEIMAGIPRAISVAREYGFNVTTRMHLIHDFE